MKYLRMTMWTGRNAAPMTSIVAETDLRVPIYTAASQQRALNNNMAGPAVEVEVHEFPDDMDPAMVAVNIAKARTKPLDEETRHTLTVFDWAMDLLSHLTSTGVAQTTQPAPLTAHALAEVLTRVAAEPAYRGQSFKMTSFDLTPVNLVNGKVTVGNTPMSV